MENEITEKEYYEYYSKFIPSLMDGETEEETKEESEDDAYIFELEEKVERLERANNFLKQRIEHTNNRQNKKTNIRIERISLIKIEDYDGSPNEEKALSYYIETFDDSCFFIKAKDFNYKLGDFIEININRRK